jgi:hypothetical protein
MKSIRYERGRSLHVFIKEFTTRILWHIASKLFREKKIA